MTNQTGNLLKERYEILNVLGEGGVGTTYQAIDQHTTQVVAIKILSIRQAEDWKTIELFEREARILSSLQHPNIPTYLDYFVIDTDRDRIFCIVQELAQGKSLFQWVQEGWRCNEKEVKAIAAQVLNILSYLHSISPPVIHRDIKPHNIIRREDGQIFLVDFGAVGSTYHNTMMRGSTVVGTFGYMAPEQFRGQATPTTDFYGLGATLLFLLTRRSPAELPTQKLKVEFRSRVQLSDSLADWIEKALEPAAKDRFESAQSALIELSRFTTKQYSIPIMAILLGSTTVLFYLLFPVLEKYQYLLFNQMNLNIFAHQNSNSDKTSIESYLDNGGDVNARSNDVPLIHLAIRSGKLANVKALVEKNVNLKVTDTNGRTPLHEAIARSYIPNDRYDATILKYLLYLEKIDINARDKEGRTILDYLYFQNSQYSDASIKIFSDYLENSQLLPSNKIEIIDKFIKFLMERNRPIMAAHLQQAMRKNDKNISNYILEKAFLSRDGEAIGSIAVQNQKIKLRKSFFEDKDYNKFLGFIKIEELLPLLPDINQKDKLGNTLLNHLSSNLKKQSDVEEIKFLLRKGADVNQVNKEGSTALLSTLIAGYSNIESIHEEVAISLINAGADPNYHVPFDMPGFARQQSDGGTALHIASVHGSSRLVKSLLQKGANPNAKNMSGQTPLHDAVFNSDLEVIKILLASNADINAEDKNKKTPLYYSYQKYANLDVAPFLLKNGALSH